mmetsp:Transcript_50303/g.75154  ORF Transcript_50303/g.75154 Transcript_50303/m.75154 type:complete len:97 (-) Transcript_50303:393-683(-)
MNGLFCVMTFIPHGYRSVPGEGVVAEDAIGESKTYDAYVPIMLEAWLSSIPSPCGWQRDRQTRSSCPGLLSPTWNRTLGLVAYQCPTEADVVLYRS